MTAKEKLCDIEKENAALREAISDAWKTFNRCQEVLADTQQALAMAKAEGQYWREVATGL